MPFLIHLENHYRVTLTSIKMRKRHIGSHDIKRRPKKSIKKGRDNVGLQRKMKPRAPAEKGLFDVNQ